MEDLLGMLIHNVKQKLPRWKRAVTLQIEKTGRTLAQNFSRTDDLSWDMYVYAQAHKHYAQLSEHYTHMGKLREVVATQLYPLLLATSKEEIHPGMDDDDWYYEPGPDDHREYDDTHQARDQMLSVREGIGKRSHARLLHLERQLHIEILSRKGS